LGRIPRQRCLATCLAAALALAGAAPALAAGDNVPSAAPAADAAGLGLNQAIREGETRRGTAPDTGGAAPQKTLSPRPEYASLPVYVGKLGNQPVRLRLGPKPDERDSVRGEYSVGRESGVRLLAGEYENGAFLMEESDDGNRVSGNWEGTIDAGGAVRGTWTDPLNPDVALPFFIRPLGVPVIPPFVMTSDSGVISMPSPSKLPAQGR